MIVAVATLGASLLLATLLLAATFLRKLRLETDVRQLREQLERAAAVQGKLESDAATVRQVLNAEIRDAHSELATREIRLAGRITWRDGIDSDEGCGVRFAMDGGVIVGAIVKESYSSWRAYARVQSAVTSPPEPGNVQSSAITGPEARAKQEVERLLRELASFERARSARSGAPS